MSRLALPAGQQKKFLDEVRKKSGLNWHSIALACAVSDRTIRDWHREKFYMNYEAALQLSKMASVSFSPGKKILPDYWSTKKASFLGAQKRYEIYGNPGTLEGRIKGGINCQNKLKADPDFYCKTGFKLRKSIDEPNHSTALSEFIGIVFGDGGVTKYQVIITLNSETDKEYALYISSLIKSLFGITSAINFCRNAGEKTLIITISSISLVEFLIKKGLTSGNKLYNIIKVPDWIADNEEYRIACLRGLMDTDGSFYCYSHTINRTHYTNFAICFANKSNVLLEYVYVALKRLNLNPSKGKYRIYLYRKNEIEKYINTVGSSNQKHIGKYDLYKRRGTEAVITGRS
jgi:hypothetical protein